MESGWLPIRRLEQIDGVNLRESLVIKNQKLDTLEKLFGEKEAREHIGK